MGKNRKPLGLLALLAVSAILVSAVIAVDADAARGAGKGGGKHGSGTTNTGSCAVTPNPATLYSSVTATGSGFPADTTLGFSYEGSAGFVISDSTGSFSRSFDALWAGTNTVVVSWSGNSVTCTFEVV